ncbi:Uncharacterised protein at_DN2435 [Pycnogonum litorale]
MSKYIISAIVLLKIVDLTSTDMTSSCAQKQSQVVTNCSETFDQKYMNNTEEACRKIPFYGDCLSNASQREMVPVCPDGYVKKWLPKFTSQVIKDLRLTYSCQDSTATPDVNVRTTPSTGAEIYQSLFLIVFVLFATVKLK